MGIAMQTSDKKQLKQSEIQLCQHYGDSKAEWFIDALTILTELGGRQRKVYFTPSGKHDSDGNPILEIEMPAISPVANYCASNGICYGILNLVKSLKPDGWKYLKGKLNRDAFRKAEEMRDLGNDELKRRTDELLGVA
jgi:hypothetical protein